MTYCDLPKHTRIVYGDLDDISKTAPIYSDEDQTLRFVPNRAILYARKYIKP